MFFIGIAIVLLVSSLLGLSFKKIGLPALVAYLLIGIGLGPEFGNLIPSQIIDLSPEIRKFALVVILLRAGLSLNLHEMKSLGRPAVMLSFFPALIEILAIGLCAPPLLALFEINITYIGAFLMGSILAAVSPAVVIPRMIEMIAKKLGTAKKIPQTIIAASSFDDVFAILVFTSCLALASGSSIDLMTIVNLPISIMLGIGVGALAGFFFGWIISKFFVDVDVNIDETVLLIGIVGLSSALVGVEVLIAEFVGFSSLLAIITFGICFKHNNPELAKALAKRFNQLWIFAEICLFVLVGAATPLEVAKSVFVPAVLVIATGLGFRAIAVWSSLIRTPLTLKERGFVAVAYMPKATVQAAIGGIPLAMGLPSGALILAVCVTAILVTAPAGAFWLDNLIKSQNK